VTSKGGVLSFLALAALLGIVPVGAWAGSALDSAQAQRSKAFNDFYTGFMNSSMQPADAEAIAGQTIGPASDATARALLQEKVSAFKQTGFQIMTKDQADAERARAKAKAEAEAENGDADGATGEGDGKGRGPESGSKEASTGAAAGGTAPGIARKPAAPETVIDGSKIPKAIIFGSGTGKKSEKK
jgi:hypothetical protein